MSLAPSNTTGRPTSRPSAMTDHPALLGFVTGRGARRMGGPNGQGTAWRRLVNDAGRWTLQRFGGLAVTRNGAMVGRVAATPGVDFPEPDLGRFLRDGLDSDGGSQADVRRHPDAGRRAA